MVKKAELSKRCAWAAKLDKTNKTAVCRVSETNRPPQRPTRGREQQQGYTSRSSINQRQHYRDNAQCYRCGSNTHAANNRKCPAFGAKCLYCGILGHFEKVCNRKARNPTIKFATQEGEPEGRESEEENEDERVLCIDEKILSVDSTQTHKPQCVLSIGGVQVSMVADSGSPFTIIQHGMWDKEFARIVGEDLLPSDIRPVTFTGEPIPMVGYRTLNFEFQGRLAEGKLYVAEKGP